MSTIIALIVTAIGVAIGIWMYNDAKRRGLKQPSIWIWVGLFLNVIGLLFYYDWHIKSKKTNK